MAFDPDNAASYTAFGPSEFGFQTGGERLLAVGVDVTGQGTGVSAKAIEGNGVLAMAEKGYGVFSESWAPGGRDNEQIGVWGSTRGGEGIGVRGPGGTGVQGNGISRGGVFSSDKGAQIKLVPQLEKLPAEAQAGDLIVIRHIDPVANTASGVELWLCSFDGDSQNPASWNQVQLGPATPAEK